MKRTSIIMMAFMPKPGFRPPSKTTYSSPQLQPQLEVAKMKTPVKTGVRIGGKSNSKPKSSSQSSRFKFNFKSNKNNQDNESNGIIPFVSTSFREGSEKTQNSENINRDSFFDDKNSGMVSFNTPLENKLYPQAKRLNSFEELRLYVNYGDFNLTGALFPAGSVAKDAYLSVFNKLKIYVNKEVRNSAWTTFTAENFNSYLEAVQRAVKLYYAVDVLMSFGPNSNSEYNLNIEAARNVLGSHSSILSNQNRLRRSLRGHYLPPNIFRMIQKFSQIHRTSELENSSSFLFDLSGIWQRSTNSVQPRFHSEDTLNTIYDGIINGLNSNIDKINVISQVFPHWEVKDLPLSTNHAQWDLSVYNFWKNTRTKYKLKADPVDKFNYFPTDAGNFVQFYSIKGEPSQSDGYIEAFCSFGTTASSGSETAINNGLYVPYLSKGSNPGAQTNTEWDCNKAFCLATSSTTLEMRLLGSGKDLIQTNNTHNVEFKQPWDGTEVESSYSVVGCGEQRVFALNKQGTEFNTRAMVEFLYE